MNLWCFYVVGTPVAVGLAFYAGLDFRGLWLGLLAAQGSCAATMLLVISPTDWDLEAKRAEELTGTVGVDHESQVEEEQKPLKAEIKEDFSILSGDLNQDNDLLV